MSERWRGVVAALLNPELRSVLAELSPEQSLTPVRRERALARLSELGLVRDDDGRPVFDEAVLRELLAEDAPAKARGPERFLDGQGRIDRYPLRFSDRHELLEWIADRAIGRGEVLSERDFNERLTPYSDDVAVLRRYLVDHELIERTRSGSEYARVSDV